MQSDIAKNSRNRTYWKTIFVIIALIPYAAYIGYIISIDRGPVDYETFIGIGNRLLTQQPIYGENSYYPMPFVMIFAVFSWLPRPLSMLLWFSIPLLAILLISNWDAKMLLFAPTLSHFLGGQSSLPGLIGFWGYRLNHKPENPWGGIWLAIIFLKPQLAVFPFIWAAFHWIKWIASKRSIPRQVWAFLITLTALYLPGFILVPDWPIQWFASPRPLFERALAGFFPRSLFYLFPDNSALFWVVLVLLGSALLIFLWIWNTKSMGMDLLMTASFIINPLVHDYDLIQLIPLIEQKHLKKAALLVSIPGWLVILFGYQNDHLWYVFTLIAPGILLAMVFFEHRRNQIRSADSNYI